MHVSCMRHVSYAEQDACMYPPPVNMNVCVHTYSNDDTRVSYCVFMSARARSLSLSLSAFVSIHTVLITHAHTHTHTHTGLRISTTKVEESSVIKTKVSKKNP
jgi:hypothetical protein